MQQSTFRYGVSTVRSNCHEGTPSTWISGHELSSILVDQGRHHGVTRANVLSRVNPLHSLIQRDVREDSGAARSCMTVSLSNS